MVVVATEDIDAGTQATLLHAAEQKIASSICYEDAYGVEMADFLPEATLLVNVSNDAWFGETIAAAQHLQIARMRALELGRPLLRATNTGMTAIVDEQGRVMAQAPAFEKTVLAGKIAGRTGTTPFARWRNLPLLLLLSLLLVAGMVMIRKK
jgi:apolipoprotein N-acyltransferase